LLAASREQTGEQALFITLALYAGAPVFVTSEMLDLSVVVSAPDALHAREIRHVRSRVEKGHPAEDPPMDGEASARCPTRERPLVLRRTLGKLLQTELVRLRVVFVTDASADAARL